MDVEMEAKAESSGNHRREEQMEAHVSHVQGLLATAKQLLSEGNPSLALQAVMAAIKANGGEKAVFEALRRARELYHNKLQSSIATNELSALFARCMIHEAEPSLSWRPDLKSLNDGSGVASVATTFTVAPDLIEGRASILAESGRKGIVMDAFMDGSSFVCLQCGGLVSNLRKDEHLAHWCSGKR